MIQGWLATDVYFDLILISISISGTFFLTYLDLILYKIDSNPWLN